MYLKNLKIAFVLIMVLVLVVGCGSGATKESGSGSESAAEQYTVWIGKGEDISYLAEYEDNPVLQYYLKDTYPNSEGTPVSLSFDFQVPAVGNERDNFNTLIATGDYLDIMSTAYLTGSVEEMYDSGVILDVTDYVEKYMPNYVNFLNSHPEMALATTNLVDGEKRYLSLYILNTSVNEFQGFLYRRDWIVKYGTNPTTGAAFSGNYTLKNDDGTWNTDSWEDDVVFPSGGSDPVYISDWEWMMEIFAKAIEDNGITDGYCMNISSTGVSGQGYLDSSFGGSAASWYINQDGNIDHGGRTEEFRTYLECISTWYQNGWIDEQFLSHSSDMPWRIDEAKVRQGKVGLWRGTESQLFNKMNLGDELTSDIIVYAASLPINDVYGSEEFQNKEPYSVFQLSKVGTPFVFTEKLKDRDLSALFTFLNTMYDETNSLRNGFGLSKEEYDATQNPVYQQWGLTDGAYYDSGTTNEQGQKVYYSNPIISGNDILNSARSCFRFLSLSGNTADAVVVDKNITDIYRHQKEQWSKYSNTGILPYQLASLLPAEAAKDYSMIDTNVREYMAKVVPEFVIGTKKATNDEDWATYLKAFNKYNPDKAVQVLTDTVNILQK